MTTHTAASTLLIVRTARGLSQPQPTDRANLSRSTVTRIETGAEAPSLRTVRDLAAALRWAAADLFALDTSATSPRPPARCW